MQAFTIHQRRSSFEKLQRWGNADLAFQYGPGGAGLVPLVGDWDGAGVDTVGVYNPATGGFFLRNSDSAGFADEFFQYGPGGAGFMALVGDWDGQ
jgi:hypothetical protein